MMGSLASRIATVAVVLVSVAVSIALGATWLMSERIASDAVIDSLEATQAMQRYLQRSRARELALTTDLLAADPHDTAYLVEATRGGGGEDEVDLRSILDLIDDRRREYGFDFAMMLDTNGQILVHTDRPDVGGRMLGDHPLVAPVIDELIPEYGPWHERNRLFNVAVVPLTTAFEVIGFLVAGLAIDDDTAADIKRVTGSDVAFISLQQGQERLGASTLDLRHGEQLFEQVAAADGAFSRLRAGEAIGRVDIDFGGEAWVARLEPISEPGGQVLGAAVAVDSLHARLAGIRTLQTALIAGGSVAIGIALLLSLVVARRIAQPVSQLASIADQAAQGDYEQLINIKRKDEVGTLARAVNRLLSDLREQQEIAGYVADLSHQLEENSLSLSEEQTTVLSSEHGALSHGGVSELPSNNAAVDSTEEFTAGPAWLIGIEWPDDSESRGTDQQTLSEIADRHKVKLVPSGDGRIILVLKPKHRDRLPDLIAEVLEQAGLDEQAGPYMALAYGDIDSVKLELEPTRYRALAFTQVATLLREASPERMLISPAAHNQLTPLIEDGRIETTIVNGRSGKRRFNQVKAVAPGDSGASSRTTTPPTASQRKVLQKGRVLGERFEILNPLGEGAMGSVYRAYDHQLDDVVALKLLKPALAQDPDYLDRMKSEIRLARRITHSNVLRTHDFFELDGLPLISMEYVRGVTLDQLLERSGRLSLAAGLRVTTQALTGLQAAHDAGVLHRDIKPGNIILDPRGNARLMDFGIAHQVVENGKDITRTGEIVGTANYMAPEILLGKAADVRSDIYSTGVMMHQLFTGELPFSGKTSMEVCMAHVQTTPRPPSQYWSDIPPALETVIIKCMAKEPGERPQSAKSLLRELLELRGQAG